jgi:hypothetical protein
VCKLFASYIAQESLASLSIDGFNDRKHAGRVLGTHEKLADHLNSVSSLTQRAQAIGFGRIDHEIGEQLNQTTK